MKIDRLVMNTALPLFLSGCATTGYAFRQNYEQKNQNQQQTTLSQLEAMTAAGEFSTIANYVHQEINEYPDKYRNEMYDGAEIALQHAPNGVYTLALNIYQEDMKEDIDSMIYALNQMRDNGFSYSYDLDYDE